MITRLEALVERAAIATPHAPALRGPELALDYAELDRLADAWAHALVEAGVARGDRVAIGLDKGALPIVIMQAVLRCAAAYVPLDPSSPPARLHTILTACAPKLVVTCAAWAGKLDGYLGPRVLVDDPPPERGRFEDRGGSEHELAYILFTSGSTGVPKGVCLSHRNALAFVAWAVEATGVRAGDRFANHAALHFDLSVFDIYACFWVGGRLSVAADLLALAPAQLIEFVRREQIDVWYSVPSALIVMMGAGLLAAPELEPRVVIFAGEPFPVRALAQLREAWSRCRMFNFYGPTETNVCTAHELGPAMPSPMPSQNQAIPIGRPASGDRVWLVDDEGRTIDETETEREGQVMVEGPTVMLGYFGGPPQGPIYATGDRARYTAAGELDYLGRRDAMLKLRGHRIEAGEVEATLERHAAIASAAVLVVGEGPSAHLVACLVAREQVDKPSLLAIKRWCAGSLPSTMLVDRVVWIAAMPLTGNGKRDLARLREAAIAGC